MTSIGRAMGSLRKAGARFGTVFLGVGLSLVARAGSSLSNLVMIPVLLAHFGIEKYGVWVFILSLSSILAFMDLGVGNSLLNRGARWKSEGRIHEISRMVSTAIWGFGAVGMGLALVLVALHVAGYPIARACGIHGSESELALLIFACQVLVAIPLAAIQRLQVGMGMGAMVPLVTVVNVAGTLTLVLVASSMGAELVPMVAAYSALQIVLLAASTVYFLRKQGLECSLSLFSPQLARELLVEGAPFLTLQVSATALYYVDNLLVVRFAGLESLAIYSIAMRAFQIIGMIPMMANTFIWPLYTVALHRGDHAEVRRISTKVVATTLVWCTLGGLALQFSFPFLFRIWLHRPELVVPQFLGLGMVCWIAVEAAGNSLGTVLNAASRMRFQVLLAPVTMVSVLGAKLAALHWGSISWLPWATVLAYLLSTFVPTALYLARHPSFNGAHESDSPRQGVDP